MNCKIIYNPAIARQLLKIGNPIVDLKPSKENCRESYFVFECTEKLLDDLTEISKKSIKNN